IITGGGRGIGRAIALRFAEEGAAVLVAARTASELETVAQEVRAAGGKAATVVADVTQEAGCEQIYRRAMEEFEGVEILVNNAGVFGPVAAAQNITAEQWDAVMAANLRGAFLMSRQVIPGMLERARGVILNVSSVAAKLAFGYNAPYAASKAGLVALTRTLAGETSPHGVRVNAICPGPVPETRMSQQIGEGLGKIFGLEPQAVLEGAMKGILQGRGQTASEVAAAAAFLCSDEAAAITGQALNVDGGMAFY
ncbi:MAG TPA: SDR family NAD(P)-dependent oxidoreductase, partial [Candidatus Acidoferrales bacterium]|nr:SDR family NAD(P)-dependent oxidoreductase [Candidatus Acidoferrales bacterium]